MRNTVINKIVFVAFVLLFSLETNAFDGQWLGGSGSRTKLTLVKTGPFLGLEQGKYLNFNFGGERQWQRIKLVKPQTHAANIQFDYNFKYKIMGAQAGYWFKVGRLNMTYGARFSWNTDLDGHHRFGFSPNVGYKFMQAHFQMGVHLRASATTVTNVNTFYASLRWVFINDRDFKKK